jgi:hypothetical protein
MPDIEQMWVGLIEHTQDPLAPIKVQMTAGALVALGKMLGGISNHGKCTEYTERLLKDFPDEELNRIACEPDWALTLASMLTTALTALVRDMATKPVDNSTR